MTPDSKKEKDLQERLLRMEEQLLEQNESLQNQIKRKSEELVKNERLATIGTMASRIAHDLKNPLTIMQTYADMLTPEILAKLSGSDKEKWLRLQNSILDMNRIIEDVLDFAKTTEIKKTTTSLLGILRLSLNHVKFPYGVQIHLPEKDIRISCDSRKIEAIFSNIINNAIHALDGQGEVNITFENDSEFAIIKIQDSGPGISDENMDKIFEPMFTTKKTGTGLGLVICKSIVEQHSGSISVSNKPTTFTVKLPLL